MNRVLKHIGTPRHSGRYPWGSGKDGYQRGSSLAGYASKLRKQGLTEVEIATGLGMSTGELRKEISKERLSKRSEDYAQALRLRQKGLSYAAIGERMGGKNESSIRSLLDPAIKERTDIAFQTANILRDNVEAKNFIDVGAGVENHMAISRTKLNTAISMLEDEGYKIHYVPVRQPGTGKFTSIKVLGPPGSEYKDVSSEPTQIKLITDYSEDGGRSFRSIEPPIQIASDRVAIAYESPKDGLIELRRGVDDIQLGDSTYSQVRIGVDGTHFLKGMAMYTDNIPDGYDILYNSNKKNGTDKYDVFKPNEEDSNNAFGSIIRQKHYTDSDGKEQLSALNIVGSKEGAGEEGAWEKWSNTLSSQVLSKQSVALAKKQLTLAKNIKEDELNEILSLTNPVLKQKLLQTYADSADKAAVDLKAAPLPGQSNHVLIPIVSLKENECYAPNKYVDGTPVVLIRHPHGGTFEIPELIVNNKNPEARRLLKEARDAVGINPKVAAKLSGADFDGDHVLVIPNRNGAIKSSPAIKSLQEFDPRATYKQHPGMRLMTEPTMQRKMGEVSNLITDMTIKGADVNEVVRAVKHSMVVIDAYKHKLDYEQSYIDNNIADLRKTYQGSKTSGASTIVSRASSQKRVPLRKDEVSVDPQTGKKVYKYLLDETYVNKRGNVVRKTVSSPEEAKRLGGVKYVIEKPNKNGVIKRRVVTATTKSTKMAEVDDAHKLSSGTKMEKAYADYANSMKALGNKARREMVRVKPISYSPVAKKTYAKEVERLKAALNIAKKNAPLERQALLVANKIINAKRASNPDMTPAVLKKIRGQELINARNRTGAGKQKIVISDREWEAIQAGAFSNTVLKAIIDNTDTKALKQRALPRSTVVLSPAKLAKARNMAELGHTQAEIASSLGVSVSTLSKGLQ